jgi:hypothetical protein
MMAPPHSVPGNHHTGNLRHLQRGIEPAVIREANRAGGQRPQAAPCLSSEKTAVAPALAQHPLAKRGVLGQ